MPTPVRIFRIPGAPAPGSNLPKLETYGFRDSFTRADSATSLGITEEGFKTWTSLRGTWGVIGGAAYVSAAVAGQLQMAVADGLAPSGVVTAVFSALSSDTGSGLVVRVQDASNHILINSAGSGQMRIWKRINGTATAVATATSGGIVMPGDTIAVEMSGQNITVRKNGVVVVTAVIPELTTQTRHGMVISDSSVGTTRITEFAHTV